MAIALGTGSGGLGTATITPTISAAGSAFGSSNLTPPQMTNANSPCATRLLDLASGFNAISVSTKAAGIYLQPPAGNTVSITLKGVTGDTGIVLSKVGGFMLTFDTTPPTTIGITTGGAIAGFQFIEF